MANRIRKISIGAEVKERFHYIVDGEKPAYSVVVNGKLGQYTLAEIVEKEKHYELHLKVGDEVHFWKTEPKNEFVAVEFFID